MAFREIPKAKWNIKARVYEGAFGRHGTTKDDLPVRAAPKFVSHPTKKNTNRAGHYWLAALCSSLR